MGSISPELSLDLKPAYIPVTISGFLREISTIGNISEKLSKMDGYIKMLEEEMRKIDAFKRELPQCMILLNDVIIALKEERKTIQSAKWNVQPVMEEFIPLRNNSNENRGEEMEKDCRDKKNWMSSVQLWSCNDFANNNSTDDRKRNSRIEMKKGTEEEDEEQEQDRTETENPFDSCKYKNGGGGAFMPFKGCSNFAAPVNKEDKGGSSLPGLSLLTSGKNPRSETSSSALNMKNNGNYGHVRSSPATVKSNSQATATQQHQSSRKQRRCWSAELHRRFVTALQQLGGSQATPKQIRELMKVDGLTNDEVKSHLQKYRLHTRRIPATTGTPAEQPVVLLRGLWMTQDRYEEASSKLSNSQSGSPQGPLQLAGNTGGISINGDSMEDEEDRRSESYSWKGHVHKPEEGEEDL